MALPFSFSNNTSPTGVQLDTDLLALGAMGITRCIATGTNTIALVPLANQPAVAAYVNQQTFVFTAAASSNSTVTALVNALAALPVYLPSGAQAGTGDILNGFPYLVQYLAALNTGSGGFQIISALPASNISPAVTPSMRGLTVNNNSGVPSTKLDIGAGYSVLITTGGSPKFLTSVSVTIDLTTTGANGMDTGSRPTSGWVYCYVISNGSVTAGLATATAPAAGLPSPFPGGYTYFAYVGAMYCDPSQNLRRSIQNARAAQYVVTGSGNAASMLLIGSGTTGTYSDTAPTYASVTVTGNGLFVPLSSGEIDLVISNKFNNGTLSSTIAAPNTTYAGIASANPPPLGLSISSAGSLVTMRGRMVLETSAVAWAGSAAGSALYCAGWTDKYSCG